MFYDLTCSQSPLPITGAPDRGDDLFAGIRINFLANTPNIHIHQVGHAVKIIVPDMRMIADVGYWNR